MISRVAEHCFWLGRYTERAESTARTLTATKSLALDAVLPPERCWRPVLIVSGVEPDFLARFGERAFGDGEQVERFMSSDEDNVCCIARSVEAARFNARSIREVVSLEVWQTLNELYLWLDSEPARIEFHANRFGFYRRVRQSMQLALGLSLSTMLHDTPLDFIWLGVFLERIGQTARLLDVHYHAAEPGQAHEEAVDAALWLWLLRACSGFEPFMKSNRGRVSQEAVASFLVGEPRFPRSIRHSARHAYECLCAIRPPAADTLPGAASLARLKAFDEFIARRATAGVDLSELHALLTHAVHESAALGAQIGHDFLGV